MVQCKLNSISYIENLSNEILYEIFEYIEYYDLLQAFSNLNNRFQVLLNYSFLSLQVNLNTKRNTVAQNYYIQSIISHKHQIVSLYLTIRRDIIPNKCSLYIIDSSFNRLQSLILDHIAYHEFILFLPGLSSLPNLSSITLYFNDSIVDLTEIYQLIFRLPFLKKLELSAKGYLLVISSPINISEQYSRIKRFIINHVCNFKEFIVLLSNTPCLTHLTCMELIKTDEEIQRIIPITMIHLKSITLNMCNIKFDQLEIFIKILCKQLRILYINTSNDVTYLDAIRWEQIILQHMPYLYIFQFEYHEWHYYTIELNLYHHRFNQFTSLFWINRGWCFQINADIDYWPPIKVVYAIRSNKKKSANSTNIKLVIDRLYFAMGRENLADDFLSFITNVYITQLKIDCRKLLHSKLFKLFSLLPNLKSLEILFLSLFKLKNLSEKTTEFVQLWSNNNQITKLIFKDLNEEIDLEKLQYFIDSCSQMKYLRVKCEKNFNIKSIVRSILMKNIKKCIYWNLFCLSVPIANDDMINQLQVMFDLEKLIDDYRITRTTDRIYLQWNLK